MALGQNHSKLKVPFLGSTSCVFEALGFRCYPACTPDECWSDFGSQDLRKKQITLQKATKLVLRFS